MFIIKDIKQNLQVHLNETDVESTINAGHNIRITLSPDKAKELEDRLEEVLKESED